VRRGATRRDFLAAIGAAGVGGALAPATAGAASAGRGTVAFHGTHQAGIATPAPDFVHFLALDLPSATAGDLRDLLAELSRAAARMAAGQAVGPEATGAAPPVDTGEAAGLGASSLTLTFGLGPRVFEDPHLGLAARRPAPLVRLPTFANDALEPSICGGDIGVQVCSDSPQVAFHAVHDLIRLASPAAVPRWSLAGFGKTRNARGGSTPRNLMGFKDGTANIVGSDPAALQQFVWAGPESPSWMAGGSYMVVRRIRMLLANWDSIGLDQQEQTFGRHKASGAPLGRRHEFDPLDLSARRDGRHVIPESAHVRLASPEYNQGQRILRRGYSYTDGVDRGAGAVAGGQLFICYQRDPRAQFIRIQKQLSIADALGQHTEHVGSAIFACPPGAPPGGFVGQTLFG
jgi:deferrochelatase/peroxidase EfeB